MVVNFYDLVTDFYEYGWGESFHFAPRHKLESFPASIARHEFYIPLRLGLKPGKRVLDVGCGVGGPARAIARFSGANVTGININDYQLGRAQLHNKRDNLDNLVECVKGDFLNMPFEDNTFDGAYELEATCHSPSLEAIYYEIFRTLKPGATFAGYAWAMTDKYDEKNEKHKRIKYRIELGNGLPPMHRTTEILEVMKKVGFEIQEVTDFATLNTQFPLPWYDALAANYTLSGFRYTRVGRTLTAQMLRVFEKVGLAPKGSLETAEMLNATAEDLVDGGRENIFTPSFFIMARKPENMTKPAIPKPVLEAPKEKKKKEQKKQQ